MDSVVMGLLVLNLTDSAFQVALLFVCRWLPMLAFALLSGMIADRANRWAIMVMSRSVAVIATAAIMALVITDIVEPWHVFIASFFLGLLFVMEFPSRRSLIYDLVGSDRIVSAMSLETINSTLGKFVGPFMAGMLIELTDFSGTYGFLVAVYVISFGLILVMRGRGPVRAAARSGEEFRGDLPAPDAVRRARQLDPQRSVRIERVGHLQAYARRRLCRHRLRTRRAGTGRHDRVSNVQEHQGLRSVASDLISIARSGTRTARQALDVTANNIANASSEGYVRRTAQMNEVMATGGMSHDPGGPKYFEIDDEFDFWLAEQVLKRRHQKV